MANKFYLDANSTDGSDPALVDRVYPDGTRVPLSEPEPEPTDLQRFLWAEPAQVENWVLNNVNDLVTARELLAKLARAVAVLAQRELNR